MSDDMVTFLREIMRIRSLPGEEAELARRVIMEMEELGFDEVDLDGAGNVLGCLRGRGEGPTVMMNTHLDHVEAGDPGAWPHPPFEAVLADGRIWGRGAVDIKGPLAAQLHGAARAAEGERPDGDVWVTAVVQEEVGGVGARHLVGELGADLVVVGEPSSNQLRRGHRGRIEIEARVRGRSAHASAPERGRNPLYGLAALLVALPDVDLPAHPELGRATVAPTLVGTDQGSPNVIPGEARVLLDCRVIPGQSADDLRGRLEPVLRDVLPEGLTAELAVPTHRRRTWRGLEVEMPADNPAYVLPEDHPAVRSAAAVLEPALGRRPEVGLWGFATDGGHFADAGQTVVGFGPGEEELAHTVDESVGVGELEEAAAGYEALARGWGAAFLEESSGGDGVS